MNFDEAVAITLQEEGPLSFDTDDGMPTKWGIRAKYYPEVLRVDFSREQAVAIYRRDYWNKISCDELPPALRFALFECAVNQGQVRAIRLLQQSLRVKEDGVIGPITIQAARQAGGAAVDEFTARRAGLYATTTGFSLYGLGWMRRLVRNYRRCLGEP